MATTKINFYIGLIGVFFIVCLSLLLLNNEMSNIPAVQLDNKSETYIEEYGLNYNVVDDDAMVSNVSVVDIKNDGIISGESENGTTSGSDVFAQLNYAKQKMKRFTFYLFAAYNMPTFILASLGLNVGYFQHVLNIITIMLYISFIVMIIRLIRGS